MCCYERNRKRTDNFQTCEVIESNRKFEVSVEIYVV